jgi:lipase chaperone LimK
MNILKSLTIIALCLLPFLLAAQSSTAFLDAKCAELSQDEIRAEAELKRIRTERAKLNASKMQLQINLYSKELTDLELEKARRIAEIETDYLKRKGEIQAKMQVAASVSTGASCTN